MLCSSSLADYGGLLFLRLVPLPVCSSPCPVFHGSDTSSILGSPTQSRLHLQSFMQWPLWVSTQGHSSICLDPATVPNLRGRFHSPLKPQVAEAAAWDGAWFSSGINLYKIDLLMIFRMRKNPWPFSFHKVAGWALSPRLHSPCSMCFPEAPLSVLHVSFSLSA